MTRVQRLRKNLSNEYGELFLEWWGSHTEDDGEPGNDWDLARKWAYDGWCAAMDYIQGDM